MMERGTGPNGPDTVGSAGDVSKVSNQPPSDARTALYRELLEREQILHELIDRALAEQGHPRALRPMLRLTPREIDILRLMSEGRTNRQIGTHLNLAPGTVRNYLGRIFRKLGVTARAQAAARAVELSLLEPDE